MIESSLKSIETKLNYLEGRTAVLENFRQTTEKDINDLKENGNFTSSQLTQISTKLKKIPSHNHGFNTKGGGE